MITGAEEKISCLRCVRCGASYREGEQLYTCPPCGLTGILDVEYDWDRLAGFAAKLRADQERSIWRYLPLLPISGAKGLPHLQVGFTPIYELPALAKRIGVRALRVKDDGRNPTASFKDRASSVGVVKARELGFARIAAASTGNAASSLAGFAAAVGIPAVIFVPATAPEPKVAQLRAFGAKVLLVDAPYDAVWELCQKAATEAGWYNRNAAVNPYLVEGKKTAGLELGEQLAGNPPDVVAVSVGDGCTIAGIWKGLSEMHRLGILQRLPRLLAVQAEGAAPLALAARSGGELVPQEAHTVADSISVGHPRNAHKALRAVKQSGGAWITVSDEALLAAAPDLAASSGVFAEPAASAAWAGVLAAREQGIVRAEDEVVVMITGSGLKDVKGAAARAPAASRIGPTLAEVFREVPR